MTDSDAADGRAGGGSTTDERGEGDAGGESDEVRVWLVERTYSDDELNVIILIYATDDGAQYHRRERALTSFSGPARETKAGLLVGPDDLGAVDDPETRARYATEAARMAKRHDLDDAI